MLTAIDLIVINCRNCRPFSEVSWICPVHRGLPLVDDSEPVPDRWVIQHLHLESDEWGHIFAICVDACGVEIFPIGLPEPLQD